MPKGVPKAGFRKTKNYYRRMAAGAGTSTIRLTQSKIPNIVGITADVKIPNEAPHALLVAKKENPIDTEKRINARFSAVENLVNAALAGDCRALIISGPPGLGKSYVVEKRLAEADPQAHNHKIAKGKVTAAGLFKLLYQYREQGQILVFDDADCVFENEMSLNFLKAACDSTETRRISYFAEKIFVDEEEGETIPKSFVFEGTIIFITNLDFDHFVQRGHKLGPHLQALMSRSFYIDMELKSLETIFVRVKQVCRLGMLRSKGLSAKEEYEVLDFMERNLHALREVSLRTALKLANIRRWGDDWEESAKITCCKN